MCTSTQRTVAVSPFAGSRGRATGRSRSGSAARACVEARVRADDGVGEQRVELGVRRPGGGVPVPVGVVVPRRGVPRRGRLAGQEVVGEPVVLDEGEVLEHPAEGEVAGRQRLVELLVGEAGGLQPDRAPVVVEEGPQHPDLVVAEGRLGPLDRHGPQPSA